MCFSFVCHCDPMQGILEKEGISGLLGRGLGTKLISNGLQGILFSVLWRLGQVSRRHAKGHVAQ